MSALQLAIERDPLGEGGLKLAYAGRVLEVFDGFPAGTDIVVKCMRRAVRNQGCEIGREDVMVSLQAERLAKSFISVFGLSRSVCGISRTLQVIFRIPVVCKLGYDMRDSRGNLFYKSEKVLVEERIHGDFVKFNNNTGETVGDPIMDFFSHWTWVNTGGRELLCDLQGHREDVHSPKVMEAYGTSSICYYLLTDPVSSIPGQYGMTDLGPEGIASWFKNHECNHHCREFHLPRPSHQAPLCRKDSPTTTPTPHSEESERKPGGIPGRSLTAGMGKTSKRNAAGPRHPKAAPKEGKRRSTWRTALAACCSVAAISGGLLLAGSSVATNQLGLRLRPFHLIAGSRGAKILVSFSSEKNSVGIAVSLM